MLYTNTDKKQLTQIIQRPRQPIKMVLYKKQPPGYSFSKSKRMSNLHLRNDFLYYISTSNHIDIPYRKPNINQQSHIALSTKTMVNYRSKAPRCFETEKKYYMHRDCLFLESNANLFERIKREENNRESFNQSKRNLNKKSAEKNYLKKTISSENKSASFLSSGRDFSVLHYHGQLIYTKGLSSKTMPQGKKPGSIYRIHGIKSIKLNNLTMGSPTNTTNSSMTVSST